jgi:transcriptional regulator with XRE-family HTH domain
MSTVEKKYVDNQKVFGENVRTIRQAKGMSQTDLAAICGYEKTAISRIENGRTNVTIKTASSIAAALETDVQLLFVGLT